MALDLSRDASEQTPAERYAVDLKLHDETIQALYGVSLRLQAAVSLVSEAPDAITSELDIAVRTIDNVIAELRERIEGVNSGESGQPQGYVY
jgi:signal transduction histidine kinase